MACALAAAVFGLTGAPAAALDLTAQKVSGWRAPGVRVIVKGWGPANGTIVLRESDHVVVFPSAGATARTGILQVRLGRDGVEGYRRTPVTIEGFRPLVR